MKQRSDKNKRRKAEVDAWRKERSKLPCDLCGTTRRKRSVHEIGRGVDRQKSLDKPYATLVLCETSGTTMGCHQVIHSEWCRESELALLKLRRPDDFDLEAFYQLTSRRFPDLDSVLAALAIISSEVVQ